MPALLTLTDGDEAKPVRLQLSRKKGFDLQTTSRALNGLPAVNVARPTKYGNPFVVGADGNREDCVRLYKFMVAGYFCVTCKPEIAEQREYRKRLQRNLRHLKGRNLACWCRGEPCHASVLLELANR